MGGFSNLATGRTAPTALRRVATLSVAFFMVACATQDTRVAQEERDDSAAARVFTVGYRDIDNIYIDDVTVSDLARAGLEHLSTLDPDIAVHERGGRLLLSVDGQTAGNFPLPDRKDTEGWANVTAAALAIGRRRSDDLEAAGPEGLYEAVFDGVLGELDPFSRYAGRDEARENRASRDGFGGIGVRIRLVEDGVRILSVMEDTPAERSGLLNNDIITHIDGTPTVGLSQRDVVRRLRGPLRTSVDLTVRRSETAEPVMVSVVRAHIVPQTVRYEPAGNVAVIRVSGFNQSTARSLREKIVLARRELGEDMAGLVLDLRDNPGGLLDQAVAVADLLVSRGRIVSTHGRHPDSHQYFDSEPDDLVPDVPVAVLVNGGSASASEIVAAALQDAGRGLVIGTTSFGKGTVQTVLRLPNEGELTLTWARFHAPSGYGLSGRGVLPDVCTNLDAASADEVLKQIRIGVLPFDSATRRADVSPTDEPGLAAFRARCPARQDDSEIDVEVATRLFESPELLARVMGRQGSETALLDGQAPAVAHSDR